MQHNISYPEMVHQRLESKHASLSPYFCSSRLFRRAETIDRQKSIPMPLHVQKLASEYVTIFEGIMIPCSFARYINIKRLNNHAPQTAVCTVFRHRMPICVCNTSLILHNIPVGGAWIKSAKQASAAASSSIDRDVGRGKEGNPLAK